MNGVTAAAKISLALSTYGESMTLQRRLVTGGAYVDYPLTGTQRHYQPSEIANALQSGDSEVLVAVGGEVPRKNDLILITTQGRRVAVMGVETIRLGAVAVAHRLWCRG